jgi:hypothetical protein
VQALTRGTGHTLAGESRFPGYPTIDPGDERGHGVIRQRLAVGWHPLGRVGKPDAADDLAGRGMRGYEARGPGVTAGHELLAGVHREAALPRDADVPLGAVPLEERNDPVGEVDAHRRLGRTSRQQADEHGGSEGCDHR